MLRRSGAGWLRAWRASNALRVYGIPTPVPLACLQRGRAGFVRDALLVTEALPGAVALDRLPDAWRGEALTRAALGVARRHHRAGLTVRPADLLAQPLAGDAAAGEVRWRVLRDGCEELPSERSVSGERADRDLEAIRRITRRAPPDTPRASGAPRAAS